ncbi:LuxR C-terminal-related transcriptional regulator [Nonomuraea sp. C10]|uniref:LuxR C-terminal-related transcriptional regulator n=1 Tax=Nonomuraea sp. C10 TaxID=2600577 RepID=UPI0021C27D5C|nr:LuxR C-terminal-related transcriptional regulator [Nonomuraea sp. C10]
MARGLSTAEIATALFISPHTVRGHLKAVFGKAGSPAAVSSSRTCSPDPAGRRRHHQWPVVHPARVRTPRRRRQGQNHLKTIRRAPARLAISWARVWCSCAAHAG